MECHKAFYMSHVEIKSAASREKGNIMCVNVQSHHLATQLQILSSSRSVQIDSEQ